MPKEISREVRVLPKLLAVNIIHEVVAGQKNMRVMTKAVSRWKKCNKCTLLYIGHYAHLCKTKSSHAEAEFAKSASTKTNPGQCNNIQTNNSNEENSESSHIYSVATVNKITNQHKYVEVHLIGILIEMLWIIEAML